MATVQLPHKSHMGALRRFVMCETSAEVRRPAEVMLPHKSHIRGNRRSYMAP